MNTSVGARRLACWRRWRQCRWWRVESSSGKEPPALKLDPLNSLSARLKPAVPNRIHYAGLSPAANLYLVALVEVRNLTRIFDLSESAFTGRRSGEVRAVDDVSLDIEQGETLGLVGESGSGKSTLGRLILRLIEPTSGMIRFGGKDLIAADSSALRACRRDMQVIFQDPFGSLDPRFRVEEVIAEPLIIHEKLNREARRVRVQELLRAVGLDESAMQRYPHEF